MSRPKVIYTNEDWKAYSDGSMHHPREGYPVDADSVTRLDWNDVSYHFPLHVMAKDWGKPETLLSAWEVALRASGVEVDEDKVGMTRVLAWNKLARKAAHHRDWERWILSGDAEGRVVDNGKRRFAYSMEAYGHFETWRKANPHRGIAKAP